MGKLLTLVNAVRRAKLERRSAIAASIRTVRHLLNQSDLRKGAGLDGLLGIADPLELVCR